VYSQSGHLSTTDQVQGMESLPTKDWHSNHWVTPRYTMLDTYHWLPGGYFNLPLCCRRAECQTPSQFPIQTHQVVVNKSTKQLLQNLMRSMSHFHKELW